VINKDGEQQALYPYNDPGKLPITPLRQPNGEWLRLEIALPGFSVWLRAWQVSREKCEQFRVAFCLP
jgi:starch phosphorylase